MDRKPPAVSPEEFLQRLAQDLRLACRHLRRARAHSLAVIIILGAGIGLATAVFTIADALIRSPLPIQDQSEVVVLQGATRDGRFDNFPLLLGDARAFAEQVRSLERVEFFGSFGAAPISVRQGSGVVRLRRSLVTGGYFDLLGTRPRLGRTLLPQDDVRGAAPVVVLSHAAWQRYFGGDPDALGRTLVLHETGEGHTIVGVMPLGLDFPRGTDFWAPVIPNSRPLGDQPVYAELSVLGRLREGATPRAAEGELTAYFGREGAPAWHRDVRGVGRLLVDEMLGDVKPAVLAFSGAAALLLLITCFNVANLLLVRGAGRVREIAVRSALGAGRRRIIGQLLVESSLLAIGGGLVGMVLAAVAVHGFVLLAPPETPRLDEIEVRGSVVAGAIAVTSLVTLFFAIPSAVVNSHANPQNALRSGSAQSGTGRAFRRGTEGIVVIQVALTLVTLAMAGVIGRTFLALQRAELALDPERLLFVELAVPYQTFGDTDRQLTLLDRLLPGVRAVPGVEGVAPVLIRPFAGSGGITAQIRADGQTPEEASRNPPLTVEVVTPDYFRTLGVQIRSGRVFTAEDREGSPLVAILSASAARHYWPSEDPVGKRVISGEGPATVVGIVADTRYQDLREPRPSLYLPLEQTSFPVAPMTLAVRVAQSSRDLVPAIREAVRKVDPGTAVASAASFYSLHDAELLQPRLNVLLLGIFAVGAVALVAVGLFAILATMVRQRTREIALRRALGATRGSAAALIVRRGMALTAAGILAGLSVAAAANRGLGALLFEVTPTDPSTFAAVSLLLLILAAIACFIPARMGSRIEPSEALRAE